MSATIQVCYTENKVPLTPACFGHYLQQLPHTEQLRILNYRRWQDRQAALLGKALLIELMKELGLASDWTRLERNAYGKPYFAGSGSNLDFNISHSGDYAVAALSPESTVGIDIEAMKALSLQDFEQCFTPAEWHTIKSSDRPLALFFKYWSIKEAVIKAAGKGLSIPLSEVVIAGDTVALGDQPYRYRILALHKDYSLVVAFPGLVSFLPSLKDYSHLFDWQ